MPSKGRQILSWVVGILIFGVLFFVLEIFSEKMGFKSNQEFQDYLKIKNIDINDLKKKFINQ